MANGVAYYDTLYHVMGVVSFLINGTGIALVVTCTTSYMSGLRASLIEQLVVNILYDVYVTVWFDWTPIFPQLGGYVNGLAWTLFQRADLDGLWLAGNFAFIQLYITAQTQVFVSKAFHMVNSTPLAGSSFLFQIGLVKYLILAHTVFTIPTFVLAAFCQSSRSEFVAHFQSLGSEWQYILDIDSAGIILGSGVLLLNLSQGLLVLSVIIQGALAIYSTRIVMRILDENRMAMSEGTLAKVRYLMWVLKVQLTVPVIFAVFPLFIVSFSVMTQTYVLSSILQDF